MIKKNITNIGCILSIFILIIILCLYLKPLLVINIKYQYDDNPTINTINTQTDNLAMIEKILDKKINKIDQKKFFFNENFEGKYTLTEIGKMNESDNTSWWLSSGGYLHFSNGTGNTILGDLTPLDPWRIAFYLSNPIDTDNGYHPQNIFRLVQKNNWKNFEQELYFKINKYNLSNSPNRNASNGVLLFNRYQDQYNLYYTGIRVDGYIIIKKKINGQYFTMLYKPIYTDKGIYDIQKNPNLLPLDTFIGIKSIISNDDNQNVDIKVYIDKDKTGKWVLVAHAIDNNIDFGGEAIKTSGFAGIRTDFMDVFFDNYKINSI